MIEIEGTGRAATFHVYDHDRTKALLITLAREVGYDLSANDPVSIGLRQDLERQLVEIYKKYYDELEKRKISEQEELAILALNYIKHRFRDDQGKYYAVVQTKTHIETLDMDGEDFDLFLVRTSNEIDHKLLGPDKRKLAITYMKAYTSEFRTLYNRCAYDQERNIIHVDLHNEMWQAVRVTKNGFEIIENPMIFRRQISSPKRFKMPTPSKDYDKSRRYLREIFDKTTIAYEHQKLIAEVYLVTLFIEYIAHPVIVPYGPKASGKTSLLRIFRLIVDPDSDDNALVQRLQRDPRDRHVDIFGNYMSMYDNESSLSHEEMDELCTWVTGFSKTIRILNTTDERRSYAGKRILGLNGVNIPVSKSDILNRCLILEMRSIEAEAVKGIRYIRESEFLLQIRKELPQILGYIFDLLGRVLQKYETDRSGIDPGNRFGDFITYGELIARELGYEQGAFVNAWNMNKNTQSMTVIHNDSLASIIVNYVYNYKSEMEFQIEPSQLYQELRTFAESQQIDWQHDKALPTNAVHLSRRLNTIADDLSVVGIVVTASKSDDKRQWHFLKDQAMFDLYQKRKQEREDAQRQAEEKKLADKKEYDKITVMKSFDKYCYQNQTTKVMYTTFQTQLLTSFKDTGQAHQMIEECLKDGKLAKNDDGDLIAGPNFKI